MRLIARLLAGATLAVATVAAVASPAAAAPRGLCPDGNPASVFGCGARDAAEDLADPVSGPIVPVDYEYYFDEAGTGIDAEPGYETGCWGIRAVPAGDGVTWAEASAQQSAQGENGVLWGNCEIEDTIDPEDLAGAYWYRATAPPPPTPLDINNGHGALAGLTTFLVIGGDIPAIATFDTPLGVLTFTMTPRYVVDWGDGASTETESQGLPPQGGPGEIVHTYTDAGSVTVTVEAYWRATWSLAGQTGQFGERAVPTTASEDLPVGQRQAVTD